MGEQMNAVHGKTHHHRSVHLVQSTMEPIHDNPADRAKWCSSYRGNRTYVDHSLPRPCSGVCIITIIVVVGANRRKGPDEKQPRC